MIHFLLNYLINPIKFVFITKIRFFIIIIISAMDNSLQSVCPTNYRQSKDWKNLFRNYYYCCCCYYYYYYLNCYFNN
jgi:hypothetical protein